jgi:hypothetical protein
VALTPLAFLRVFLARGRIASWAALVTLLINKPGVCRFKAGFAINGGSLPMSKSVFSPFVT